MNFDILALCKVGKDTIILQRFLYRNEISYIRYLNQENYGVYENLDEAMSDFTYHLENLVVEYEKEIKRD